MGERVCAWMSGADPQCLTHEAQHVMVSVADSVTGSVAPTPALPRKRGRGLILRSSVPLFSFSFLGPP